MTAMNKRFKDYEDVSDYKLAARLPIILRLDGNSFSKLTKADAFEKPFDPDFISAMTHAAKAVLDYCSGSCVAYVQSDEISILLRNDQTVNTQPFLANRIQKLVSLCAAKASVEFCDTLRSYKSEWLEAVFDCRAFTVPPSEVNNYFLWRQNSCFTNMIHSYAYWEVKKNNKERMKRGLRVHLPISGFTG